MAILKISVTNDDGSVQDFFLQVPAVEVPTITVPSTPIKIVVQG